MRRFRPEGRTLHHFRTLAALGLFATVVLAFSPAAAQTWVELKNVSPTLSYPTGVYYEPTTRAFHVVDWTKGDSVPFCFDGSSFGQSVPRVAGIAVDGGTYDPFNFRFLVLQQDGTLNELDPVTRTVVRTVTLVRHTDSLPVKGGGLTVGDDGRLYVIDYQLQRVLVFERFATTSTSMLVDPNTNEQVPANDLIANRPGYAVLGIFHKASNAYRLVAYDGTILASVSDMGSPFFDPPILVGMSECGTGFWPDGAEMTDDGVYYVVCASCPPARCKVFAQKCTDDGDCTAPGTFCDTSATTPHCAWKTFARTDHFTVQTNSTTTLVVTQNDGDSKVTCGGTGPDVTEVTAGFRGGETTISNDAKGVVYKPATDFCGTDFFRYTIAGGTSAKVYVTVGSRLCGDGSKTGDEGCDDGNRMPGDGCNEACYVEAGYACTKDADCEGNLRCDSTTKLCTKRADGDSCVVDGDCQSDFCGADQKCHCGDGTKNDGETDVDCGGSICGKCTTGQACTVRNDCESGHVCSGGFCKKLDGEDCTAGDQCASNNCGTDQKCHCGDGTKNDGETDVDCGGTTCGGCATGKSCSVDGDCAAGNKCDGGTCKALDGGSCNGNGDCLSGTCGTDQKCHCGDGTKNDGETDVDCGGGTCGPCATGKSCSSDTDCASGNKCKDNVCKAKDGETCAGNGDCLSAACGSDKKCHCGDGEQNDGETGVDCGGSLCGSCTSGQTCVNDIDCGVGQKCVSQLCKKLDGVQCAGSDECASGTCGSDNVCHCGDGLTNDNETGTDCGGSICNKCGTGQTCKADADCASGNKCVSGICRKLDGEACSDPGQCASNTCGTDGKCHCGDGEKNDGESDVDCGGSRCGTCAIGQFCLASADCQPGSVCDQGRCKLLDGGSCTADADCVSGSCGDDKVCHCGDGVKNDGESDVDCGGTNCGKCGDGQFCQFNIDCQPGSICDQGRCRRMDGESCDSDEQCVSGSCEGTCVSCKDGKKNNGETDIDCGGPKCGGCETGKVCANDADCGETTRCSAGVCKVIDDQVCADDADCVSDICHPSTKRCISYCAGASDPKDCDGDGKSNVEEDLNGNKRVDPGESDWNSPAGEVDSDGDGIPDNVEDRNGNGKVDPGEMDPSNPDTDGDGIPDGVEDKNHNGVRDTGETDALKADTDGDGLPDGVEDANHNGQLDPGETDPLDWNDLRLSGGGPKACNASLTSPGESAGPIALLLFASVLFLGFWRRRRGERA